MPTYFEFEFYVYRGPKLGMNIVHNRLLHYCLSVRRLVTDGFAAQKTSNAEL